MTDGSTPRFLQGAFEFVGAGYDKPVPLDGSLRYVVPPGATTQPVYFRGGNSAKQMVTVVLFRDGVAMRYFPIAAKGPRTSRCVWWRTCSPTRCWSCPWPRRTG